MSEYAWFALKGIGYLVLIGFVCWLLHSAWPLWALLLMPEWGSNDAAEQAHAKDGSVADATAGSEWVDSAFKQSTGPGWKAELADQPGMIVGRSGPAGKYIG